MAGDTGLKPNERLVFTALNCVGLPVQVHTRTGTVYEGIYQTAQLDPSKPDPGVVVLSKVRARQHGPKGHLSETVTSEVVVKAEDLVQIIVPNMDFSFAQSSKQGDHTPMNARHEFQTDTEIGSTSRFRSADSRANELVAWDAGSAQSRGKQAGVSLDMDADSGKSWDQFKYNETKFGVKTTWDENMYTTKLDMSKVDHEQVRNAERMAREIEKGSRPGATDHMDEEDRFGAVLRDNHRNDGRYSPPVSRQPSRNMVATTNAPPGGPPGRLASDDKGKYVPPNRRLSGQAEPDRQRSGSRSRDQSPAQRGTPQTPPQHHAGAPPGISAPATKASPPPAPGGKPEGKEQVSRSEEVASLRKFSQNFNLETEPNSKKIGEKSKPVGAETAVDTTEEKKGGATAVAAAPKLNPKAAEFKPNPNATAFVPKKAAPPVAAQPVPGMYMANPAGMPMMGPGGAPMYAPGMPPMMPPQGHFAGQQAQFVQMQQMQMQMMMQQQQQQAFMQQQGQFPPPPPQ